jgi:hypothetical protein
MYTRNPSLGGVTPGGCYTMYTMYTRNPSLGGGTPGGTPGVTPGVTPDQRPINVGLKLNVREIWCWIFKY